MDKFSVGNSVLLKPSNCVINYEDVINTVSDTTYKHYENKRLIINQTTTSDDKFYVNLYDALETSMPKHRRNYFWIQPSAIDFNRIMTSV